MSSRYDKDINAIARELEQRGFEFQRMSRECDPRYVYRRDGRIIAVVNLGVSNAGRSLHNARGRANRALRKLELPPLPRGTA